MVHMLPAQYCRLVCGHTHCHNITEKNRFCRRGRSITIALVHVDHGAPLRLHMGVTRASLTPLCGRGIRRTNRRWLWHTSNLHPGTCSKLEHDTFPFQQCEGRNAVNRKPGLPHSSTVAAASMHYCGSFELCHQTCDRCNTQSYLEKPCDLGSTWGHPWLLSLGFPVHFHGIWFHPIHKSISCLDRKPINSVCMGLSVESIGHPTGTRTCRACARPSEQIQALESSIPVC